ncbi:MAG: hypothetical protein ACTSU2_12080, partial [Promethearchaeota archaeon]
MSKKIDDANTAVKVLNAFLDEMEKNKKENLYNLLKKICKEENVDINDALLTFFITIFNCNFLLEFILIPEEKTLE